MHQEIPWHVLHVASNQEKRVSKSLEARSIEHYLPLFSERRRWVDRTVLAEAALFPGYVFIRFPPPQRVSVISTPGVLRLLGESARDVVSGTEMERIRTALARGELLRPHSSLSVGKRVRVLRGVFAGMEGTVRELRHQSCVVLSLGGLNQSFSLEIDCTDLEMVKDQAAVRVLSNPRPATLSVSPVTN